MANPMKKIKVEKLTLNIGAGRDQARLEKGMKLLKAMTGIPPVKIVTQKRIQAWDLRPGLPIGAKITIRGKQAHELIGRLLQAKDKKLGFSNFDDEGNVSWGVHEYIDIPGVKYDPEIGIIGLQICVKLQRPGFRISKRRIRPAAIPKDHRISREDAIEFMKIEFGAKVGEEA